MTQARLAADLTNDAVVYALGASVAFLLFAIILDPKLIRSQIGRSLITLDAGLTLLYLPSVLHRFTGLHVTQIGFAWYYLVTVMIVGSATLWRTVIMVRAQYKRTE